MLVSLEFSVVMRMQEHNKRHDPAGFRGLKSAGVCSGWGSSSCRCGRRPTHLLHRCQLLYCKLCALGSYLGKGQERSERDRRGHLKDGGKPPSWPCLQSKGQL